MRYSSAQASNCAISWLKSIWSNPWVYPQTALSVRVSCTADWVRAIAPVSTFTSANCRSYTWLSRRRAGGCGLLAGVPSTTHTPITFSGRSHRSTTASLRGSEGCAVGTVTSTASSLR